MVWKLAWASLKPVLLHMFVLSCLIRDNCIPQLLSWLYLVMQELGICRNQHGDFAGFPKSCLQGLLLHCSGAVAQAGVWLATCLRIIGDNNFPSLNSCFGLSTCSNSSLSSNIYPASPYKYFYPDSAFS